MFRREDERVEKMIEEYEEELAEYEERWPDYCRECDARGEYSWGEDPSSPGISLGAGRIIFADPCEDCWGVCPRCGESIGDSEEQIEDWYSEGDPCPHCGWNWGEGEDDYPPVHPHNYLY